MTKLTYSMADMVKETGCTEYFISSRIGPCLPRENEQCKRMWSKRTFDEFKEKLNPSVDMTILTPRNRERLLRVLA